MTFKYNTRRFSLQALLLALVMVGLNSVAFAQFAQTPTATTLDPIPTPLTAGQTYSFSGRVVSTSSSSGLLPNGRTVSIRLRTGGCTGSESQVATATTTGGTGHFSGTFIAPSSGTYGIYAHHLATVGYLASSSACQTVTVNAPCTAPIVAITGPTSGSVYAVGTPVIFTGTFTDDAGDTHTANWMFDTITQPAYVVEPDGSTPGSADAVYTFTQAGVYAVKLTVSDDCGLSDTATTVDEFTALVVIYDPSAGWVTGGGWINSPAGAYTLNPSLTGKANFGFVSKYQNGASVPTGNTEFHFKAGDLKFKSTSYEWMVISGGKKAQYKGFGTINGGGNYRFMLTAIDGDKPGGDGQDKFRIRIWSDGGGLVYDNQLSAPDNADPTTVLGGGSIQIHN